MTNDFTNAQNLYTFVEFVEEQLRLPCHGYSHASLVDFGDDNLLRPPAITFAPALPATMQPRIYFRYQVKAHKLEINVAWPHCDNDGGYGRPSDTDLEYAMTTIKVSADKSAAQVARDIANRLLSGYLRMHEILRDRIAAHQNARATDLEIATRLAQGKNVHLNTNAASILIIGLGANETGPLGSTWGEAAVSNGKVTLELRSLTEEQTAAVLAALGVTP